MPGNPHLALVREKGFDGCVEKRLGEAQHPINDGANQYYRDMGEHTNRASAARCDGRNDVGERVASGVHVYQEEAGAYREAPGTLRSGAGQSRRGASQMLRATIAVRVATVHRSVAAMPRADTPSGRQKVVET